MELWGQVDPLTRCVVTAFAWRIGDEARGDLSGDTFIGAMTEAFDTITAEDTTKAVQWGGAEGVRNTIVNKASGLDPEAIHYMTEQLRQIAGGGEAVIDLAELTGRQLAVSDHNATPALRF